MSDDDLTPQQKRFAAAIARALIRAAQAEPEMPAGELGDYTWLSEVTSIRRGTLQSMVSRGQVPGVVRLSPRLVRFNKAIVRAWLASRTMAPKR